MNDKFMKETAFLKLIHRKMRDVRLINGDEEIDYARAFKSDTMFTEFISKAIDGVAGDMKLSHYREYYTIDHVLYAETEDKIPEGVLSFGSSRVQGTWLKHFPVIVEHENHLDGDNGGYQEFSKLMLFKADLKVLMGYGKFGDNYDAYAKDYQWLYRSEPSEQPVLFIGEYKDMTLDAYLILKNELLKYQWDCDDWIRI